MQPPAAGLDELGEAGRFAERHLGPDDAAREVMFAAIGVASADELVARAVPDTILEQRSLDLPAAVGETEVLDELRGLAARNTVLRSFIGMGYHGTVTPPVVQRNVLEDPSWYTAYTPYQPEISQGRLEALLIFQTMVCDLTGMELCGASLLDEATAAAEAMTMARRQVRGGGDVVVVDADAHPQTLAVLATRAEPLGIRLEVRDLAALAGESRDLDDEALAGLLPDGTFALFAQHFTTTGALQDVATLVRVAHAAGAQALVATDLLACTLVTPPGELGADVVVGTSQRFGVPMLYGGPHAAFLACRESAKRTLPGRLVGVSVDTQGRPALRLALQTREQHIRREKATSNICTAQVLLAVVSAMYAAWHGPDGLTRIATRVHRLTAALGRGLEEAGFELGHRAFFDTVTAVVPDADAVMAAAVERGYNLRRVATDRVGVSLDEIATRADVAQVLGAFGVEDADVDDLDRRAVGDADGTLGIPPGARRASAFMEADVFHRLRSETQMLRELRRLSDRDLALDRTMIPLGSCTMKLNATTEMASVTWPAFADLHPFAPVEQTVGTRELISQLEGWLAEVTGYAAVSVQPNAGSQGEFAGLMAIRSWHRANGDDQRDVCLIPESAHGTNAASAVMAGMRVVVVDCDDDGNVDVDHVKRLVTEHSDMLAALMVTYPSTHGVYERDITYVCDLVHDHGGQVYLDGANLNALVGLGRPGTFGSDVSHLNLHKTFCIPHGGGGPGVGPIGVAAHLAEHLPDHPVVSPLPDGVTGSGAVSAAPWGSAGILQISWAYVRMMGPDGLRAATVDAITTANYVAARLREHFPVLYTGANGLVAHEAIIDLRQVKAEVGISNEDVAKRLIDLGFHAPTMSFPVAGTLMIEPTESEDLAELDRFCDAMAVIADEVERVRSGEWPADDNPLVNAPHTAADLLGEWDHAYSREVAAYPGGAPPADKYWPPVSRVDGVHGDRNLVCDCAPLDAYREQQET